MRGNQGILVRCSEVFLVRNMVILVPTGKVVLLRGKMILCNGTFKSKNYADKYRLEDITFSSVYCGTRPSGQRADSRSSGNEPRNHRE